MIDQDLYLKSEPTLISVRCPSCMKLYSVNSQEIFESKPKFACVGCQQKFWIPYPEALEHKQAIMGFPLEWIEEAPATEKVLIKPNAKAFSCPSCAAPYSGGESECPSCGIIFEKFESRKRDINIPEASTELKDFWEAVINDYDKTARHDSFLAQAMGEGALNYAAYRYQQILSVNAADENALAALRKIDAMSVAKMQAAAPVKTQKFNFKLPKLKLVTFMLLLCGVVIAMGLLIPGARNLVGIGSSFLFMLLALRYYFRII